MPGVLSLVVKVADTGRDCRRIPAPKVPVLVSTVKVY